jgi:hypothetical protein
MTSPTCKSSLAATVVHEHWEAATHVAGLFMHVCYRRGDV